MRGVYPESQAPPHDGPRRWITCPECGSTDEASDTSCTNLACPSLARRHERVEERIEAETYDPTEGRLYMAARAIARCYDRQVVTENDRRIAAAALYGAERHDLLFVAGQVPLP